MKIQVQFDVALLAQMTHETRRNLNDIFEEITYRAIEGEIQNSLTHPLYGTALSYKVLDDNADINLPQVIAQTEILLLPAPTQGE